ncbi:unnamed protein product [Rodentolepis nana]|uniref:non-specific protein-tyrosine kinase n=1 Tax=Rodentolepis nana TaxID=102285 RepID=A0A158QHY8_RODNA|nr:unnamed protein product [Rodentolepis nana]
MSSSNWLRKFLDEVQLPDFFDAFKDVLQVTQLQHFSYVRTADLHRIGLSAPAIARIKAALKIHRENAGIPHNPRKKLHGLSFGIPLIDLIRYGPPRDVPILTPGSDSGYIRRCHSDATSPPLPSTSDSHLPCQLIRQEDVTLHEVNHGRLGSGSFGVVRRGDWKTPTGQVLPVALKILRRSKTEDAADFFSTVLSEVMLMQSVSHPNLVRIYGIIPFNPLVIVTELAPLGSLLTALRIHSHRLSTSSILEGGDNGSSRPPATAFSVDILWDMSIQLARGMAHLASCCLIHRDLAARNVLLFGGGSSSAKGDDCQPRVGGFVVKIGDFGLLRRGMVNSSEEAIGSSSTAEGRDDQKIPGYVYTGVGKQKIPFAWSPVFLLSMHLSNPLKSAKESSDWGIRTLGVDPREESPLKYEIRFLPSVRVCVTHEIYVDGLLKDSLEAACINSHNISDVPGASDFVKHFIALSTIIGMELAALHFHCLQTSLTSDAPLTAVKAANPSPGRPKSPPEAIKARLFSQASDVWSWGVTVWEMWSGGAEPWPTLGSDAILSELKSGRRLAWPRTACPRRLYQLLLATWRFEPAQRPSFEYLVDRMDKIRPSEVVATQSFDEADRMDVMAGDRILVIDGGAANFWWRGQNRRTGEIASFPREIVRLQRNLQSQDISRPIENSFVHVGHHGFEGRAWGHVDHIDPSFLSGVTLHHADTLSHAYARQPLTPSATLNSQSSWRPLRDTPSSGNGSGTTHSVAGFAEDPELDKDAPRVNGYDEVEDEDERRLLDSSPNGVIGRQRLPPMSADSSSIASKLTKADPEEGFKKHALLSLEVTLLGNNPLFSASCVFWRLRVLGYLHAMTWKTQVKHTKFFAELCLYVLESIGKRRDLRQQLEDLEASLRYEAYQYYTMSSSVPAPVSSSAAASASRQPLSSTPSSSSRSRSSNKAKDGVRSDGGSGDWSACAPSQTSPTSSHAPLIDLDRSAENSADTFPIPSAPIYQSHQTTPARNPYFQAAWNAWMHQSGSSIPPVPPHPMTTTSSTNSVHPGPEDVEHICRLFDATAVANPPHRPLQQCEREVLVGATTPSNPFLTPQSSVPSDPVSSSPTLSSYLPGSFNFTAYSTTIFDNSEVEMVAKRLPGGCTLAEAREALNCAINSPTARDIIHLHTPPPLADVLAPGARDWRVKVALRLLLLRRLVRLQLCTDLETCWSALEKADWSVEKAVDFLIYG